MARPSAGQTIYLALQAVSILVSAVFLWEFALAGRVLPQIDLYNATLADLRDRDGEVVYVRAVLPTEAVTDGLSGLDVSLPEGRHGTLALDTLGQSAFVQIVDARATGQGISLDGAVLVRVGDDAGTPGFVLSAAPSTDSLAAQTGCTRALLGRFVTICMFGRGG
jgi:hypothetical protein